MNNKNLGLSDEEIEAIDKALNDLVAIMFESINKNIIEFLISSGHYTNIIL